MSTYTCTHIHTIHTYIHVYMNIHTYTCTLEQKHAPDIPCIEFIKSTRDTFLLLCTSPALPQQ